MKELIIDYKPATDTNPAQVEVAYHPEAGAEMKSGGVDFSFELEEDERDLIQWYMEDYLLYPYAAFVDRARKAEELLQSKGEELFKAIFSTGKAFEFYIMNKTALSDCRIIVCASDPVGWSLPWELMRDPDIGYLAQKAYSFVRSRPTAPLIPVPLDTGQQINILMIIARPDGRADVRFQSVARPLLEIFRPHRDRINLEILRPPTFEKLTEVLTNKSGFYHVIHFDGHGQFAQGVPGNQFYGDGGGVLTFEKEDGGRRIVSAEEFGNLLKARNVPLVMLNACQSGMTSPEAVYTSLGDRLLDTGARGVVAMAYSVYVTTAAKFIAKVYGMLVDGMTLDRAISAGREMLSTDNLHDSPVGEIRLQDWSVPVLFQAGEVRLFEPKGESLELHIAPLKDDQAEAGTEIDLPEKPDFGFIGRDALILDMETAFRSETVVLLQGMAGMGKSTAAVGFARWWAETGALGGPVFFFDFQKHLTLANVCDRVGGIFQASIKQLGMEWHLLKPEQRENLAADILKQVPCLIIWDNFETVAGFPTGTPSTWTSEEQNELAGFLRKLMDGKTKVIITSRRDEKWLGNCYRVVETGGLDMLESSELAGKILDRAGVNRQKLKPYHKLLEYLQGNPLAIQVIMPELKNIEPDDLLRSLQSGKAGMKSDDESQGRTRSLAASLSYRLDNLDSDLLEKLSILSLFQGFVYANVLEVICKDENAPPAIKGLDGQRWTGMLNTARDVGLLREIGPGLYRIHPALPWFFREAMENAFPEQRENLERIFVRICGMWGHQLFEMFETNAQMAMALLRLEEPNLTHALRLARHHEDWESVADILYGLNQLMDVDGRWTEWERILSDVEADAAHENGEPLPGRESLWRAALGHRAEILRHGRDFDEAVDIYQRLHRYYEAQAGDEWQDKEREDLTSAELNGLRNAAVALHQSGMIAQERRDFDEAEKCYRRSLDIEEKIGDEYKQGATLHQLGRIAQERRDFDEAEKCYRRSLAIKGKIGDELGQATTLHQLGMIAQERRDFDEAEKCYRRSLAIKGKIGNELGQATTLHQLGMIAQERRDFDEAEKCYRRSLAIIERIGDDYGHSVILHQLGRIAEGRRNFGEAEKWHRRSLAIKEKIGDEHGQAGALHQLGRNAEEQEHFDEAEAFYLQAEAIFQRMNDPYTLAIVQRSLKRVREQRDS